MRTDVFPKQLSFNDNFVSANGLDKHGFKKWCFYHGMLLNNRNNWWGTPGTRHSPHEGLDLCLYMDDAGSIRRLGEQIKIPVMYDGQVEAISDNDFLGKSIYVSHGIYNECGKELFTVYAHAEPLQQISPGTRVIGDQIIAEVVDFKLKKAKMFPHLHISMAWIPETFPPEKLTWKIMGDPTIVTLCDPLECITRDYTTMTYRRAVEIPAI